MTIVNVAERFDGTTTTGGASWNMSLAAGASITVGNTLVLTVAARDTATPPAAGNGKFRVGNASCVDVRGNVWRLISVSSNEGASTAADDGATSYIWVCHVVYPYLNGDNIVLNAPIASRPMTHVAGRIVEYSGILRASAAIMSSQAVGNNTAANVTLLSPTAAGQIVLCTAAVASNPALTGDADTTNGSWTAIDQATSGGGGIRRGDQEKIVTASGAQNWNITWTGTQQFAATGVVLAEAVYAWPYDLEYLGNPNFPCPAGPEILPLDVTEVGIDTGTGYIFESDMPAESVGVSSVYWSSNIQVPRPDVDTQHAVCCEVYESGLELQRNEPFIFTLGTPDQVTLGGTASIVGGGSAVAALSGAGSSYLLVPDGSTVDVWWDTSALLSVVDDFRVLNARLSYVAWKDDSAAAEPGEGLAVYWADSEAYRASATSGATRLYGTWLVNEYRPNARYVSKNLGEVNGYPRFGAGGGGEMVDNLQACWTLRDFLSMRSSDRSTWIRLLSLSGSHPSQQQVMLDTVRLDLFLVRETRLAQSVRRVSSGVGFPNGNETGGGVFDAPLFAATNTAAAWPTPTVQTELATVIREPIPASGSDWFSAQTDPLNITSQLGNYRYSSMEQVGPSVVMYGIVQPRETLAPMPSLSRVEWSVGQIAPEAVPEPYGEIIPSVALLNVNSLNSWWPYYRVNNFLAEGPSSTVTVRQDIGVDGGTSYDYLKVLVRPSQNTVGNLNFSIEQPTATVIAVASVSVADVLAQPDLGNGYREMHIPLSTTITPTAGFVEVYGLSTTPDNSPWIIGEAIASSPRTTYDPTPLTPDTVAEDWAIALCCPLPDIDLSIASSEISTNSTGTACADIVGTIPCITVENGQNYDWIAIERYVSNLDRTPVALIPGGAATPPDLQMSDAFGRVVANGWGVADTGQAWAIQTGTAADFSVGSGRGQIAPGAISSARVIQALTGATSNDITAEATFDVSAVPTGGSTQGIFAIRANATATTAYYVQFGFTTTGTVTLSLRRAVGGVPTLLATMPTIQDYAPGAGLHIRISAIGSSIRAAAWVGNTDPGGWQVSVTDTNVPSGGYVEIDYVRNTGADPSTLYTDDLLLYDHVPVAVEFCDYGVPWDLTAGELSYVAYGFRDHDRRRTPGEQIVWNDVSTNPGAAFGLATEDALYVYVPVSDSGELEVEWNPLNPIESMPLAGKDYQIALRSPEDRGLNVTVTVVANKLTRCTVDSGPEVALYGEGLYGIDYYA